jgi:hypothetical protein
VAFLKDARHERQIRDLGEACITAQALGDRNAASALWEEMRQAIAERSSEQIRRMEAPMGLRIRRQVKSKIMTGFCHGVVPASVVDSTFRLLDLRGV